tara:strand:+ start:11030 stop:13777 length:2748 start_codon:yes stop_codon:yes gene_type:complete
MKTFLSEVVANIIEEGFPLAQTICVLPSERAGVFLKEELKKQVTSTTFLPEIISIENFIETVSGFIKMDTIPLLFEFYKVYLDTQHGTPESFDGFSQWASVALQDFNEVDRHLVDTNDLFSYLKDIKRLENWNLDSSEPMTDMVSNHFTFMDNLGLYYNAFYSFLSENKKGYQGLLYREAALKIESYISNNSEKRIVLIGFNALNKSEELIFKLLLESKLATAYWDADAYYMDSKKEAGVFLRRYKKDWSYFENNNFKSIVSNFTKEKYITEIAASKNVSQIKSVGELLSQKENLENTALVLADESLLSLTLNSLPENVDRLNITMGYFLKDMPIAGFFEALFELYLNQIKLDKVVESKFYYKDVFRLLEHPFLLKFINSSVELDLFKKTLILNNEVFIKQDSISKLVANQEKLSLVALLFNMSQNVAQFIASCIELIELQKDNFEGFEKECLYRYFNLFVQLQNLNGEYKHIRSIKTLQAIYNQLIGTEKLSFQGEPLSGLQLMGMLETRVLDFETVIITSMNEGILPAGKNENSFIPFDVKQQYNLPTYQEKDAIFSYHFYRLLQRAKHVYLFYNTETDAYGSGEKSRFLTQLEIEGLKVSKKTIAPMVVSEIKEEVVVEKTDAVIAILKEIAEKGFSPSALAKYIEDPISYYKRYVLKIKDLDEVEETVAANTMGTIIHDVLEDFYKSYLNAFLKVEDVRLMISQIEEKTKFYFEEHYKNGDIYVGKNKLIFEVAKNFILKFLQSELKLIKEGAVLKILGTETKLFATIKISNLNFPIKIGGTVDRIDELDGVLRIVDYKTGKVVANELKIVDFEMIPTDYKYTKAMQVLLYAFLYSQNNNVNFENSLQSGIFSFKNRKAGFLKLNFAAKGPQEANVNEERLEEFMEVIKNMIAEIFDQKIPFKENIDRPFK